jgi:hypothetical protein
MKPYDWIVDSQGVKNELRDVWMWLYGLNPQANRTIVGGHSLSISPQQLLILDLIRW